MYYYGIEVEKSGAKWWKKKWGGIQLLIGEYEHSLDAKGRLIMPAKLRQDIGEKFVITKGLDGCLFALSQEANIKAQKSHQYNSYYYPYFFL